MFHCLISLLSTLPVSAMAPLRYLLLLSVLVVVVRTEDGGDNGVMSHPAHTIVHLFEWRWDDIALECKNFLAPMGFWGVQVSPPQEHPVSSDNSWKQRYQPVSYDLESRSGTKDQFVDMVRQCNDVGVRVVVDAVINNMAEQHTTGYGSAGNFYDTDSYTFPPYDDPYFFSSSCPSPDGMVSSYSDPSEVRDCRLEGRLDLATGKHPLQLIIAYYLNELLSYGVVGFRIDAASNIWPKHLQEIRNQLTNLSESAGFPANTLPFIYQDVVPPGTAILPQDYYDTGLVTENLYGEQVSKGINDFSLLENIYDPLLGMAPPNRALVFIDSHLSQRSNTSEVLTHEMRREYQMAAAFMLADNYGVVRLMSSYSFSDSIEGPPLDSVTNTTLPVITSPDMECDGGWVCEHRWSPIANMVEFRNAVAGTNRSRFEVLSSGVLLLNRGAVGLFVLTPDGIMDELINTGLPEGEYWDIVSGWNDKLVVQADGTAWLTINSTDVPFVAFCVDCGPEKFSTTEAITLKTTPLYSTSEEMISETSTSTNERSTDYSTLATETTEYSTASDTATNETVTGDYTSYGPSSYYSTSYEPSSDYPSSYKSSTDYSTTPDHSTSYEPSTHYSTSYEPSSDYSSYEPSSDYSSYEPSSDYSFSYEPSSDYSSYEPSSDYSSYEPSSDYSSSYEPSSDYSSYEPSSDYSFSYEPSSEYSSYEPSSDYSSSYEPSSGYSSYEPSSDYSSSYEPSSGYSSSYEPSSDYSSSYEPSSDYSSYEPSSDYSSSYEASSDYSSSNKPSTDYPSSYKTTTNSFSSYRPSTVSSTSYEPSTDHSVSQQPSTNYSTSYATTTHFFPTTTESPYKSTVIFMKKKVYDSQYVFLRGGLNEEDHPECGPPAETDICAIPITLQSLGSSANYVKYNAWREEDHYMDWFGAESDQGQYQGIPASGSPMAWTTNQPGFDGYQDLNIYGEDYWMMKLEVDCSSTDNGWFEIKGWLEFAGGYSGWEIDIQQGLCGGAAGGLAPSSSSTNHKARCGFINIFTWNEGECTIEPFPDGTTDTPPSSSFEPGSSEGPSVQRTVIFLEQHTIVGQNVFILGGSEDMTACTGGSSDAESDPCSMAITTRSLGLSQHYSGYNDWRVNDNFLDWHGAEDKQGLHLGQPPYGSPSVWTSNVNTSPGYQSLNTFGEAYWMLDFDLDCSLTNGGWFVIKGWLSGEAGEFSGLEEDVTQQVCSGSAGGPPPFPSSSHMAKCGHINIFHYDRGDCTINTFP